MMEGLEFEMGLTGSKMHGVACAAASSAFPVAQAWYVAPASFDPSRIYRRSRRHGLLRSDGKARSVI